MVFEDIKVNRLGLSQGSYMITENIIGSVLPNTNYINTINGLIKTSKSNIDNNSKLLPVKPDYVSIQGKWTSEESEKSSNANLLGGFGSLKIKNKTLEIPENLATRENLAYYGAKLVKLDDIFEFETEEELPVTIMNIGCSYVADYLKIQHLGGGVYIEYHDRPHFHLPIDSKATGHMIIGDQIEGEYRLSAYKIPFGYGIYTPPNLLHADAFLIGKYLVVYSITEHFSTVLFKQKSGELVDVNIDIS